MASGEPFDMNKVYRVAVNSYRGNGGGDLLTKGAGIPKTELAKRIVYSTDKDLRFYLMKRIEEVKVLDPKPLNQWKFIPEEWTIPASKRDYDILFGEKNRNRTCPENCGRKLKKTCRRFTINVGTFSFYIRYLFCY